MLEYITNQIQSITSVNVHILAANSLESFILPYTHSLKDDGTERLSLP